MSIFLTLGVVVAALVCFIAEWLPVDITALCVAVIGTSTNVLASGISKNLGFGEFRLFQFTKLGILTFLVGLAYLAFIAPRLLPKRKNLASDLVSEDYGLEDYVTEVIVNSNSKLIGKTLRSAQLRRDFQVDVLEIIRDGERLPQPIASRPIRANDILMVRGKTEDVLQIRTEQGLDILPDIKFKQKHLETELSSAEEGIAEVLILSNSRLIGTTFKDLRFRQRYNLTVLAIRRGEEIIRDRLDRVRLRFGDLLLVQGAKQSLIGLQTTRELLVIEQKEPETIRRDKAWIAIGIILGVIIIAALDWMPILVSALLGVVLMIITGCLKPGELYGAVRWDVIFLLAGLIPLGTAMENSGATKWLADNLLTLGGNLNGYWILLFFFVITSLLTEILSNNASVVLLIPLAVEVAKSLALNPLSMIFAVTFAASNSFMTPIGYQTNTMVYSPGGYKFSDFFRVGAPLNLLMAIVTPLLIVWLYGL